MNKNEFRFLKKKDLIQENRWIYECEAGRYTESSLIRLIFSIVSHRLHHLRKEGVLRD